MPQNPARTARTRAEILDHAGRLFRLRGYAGTNIDDIMLAAGLTRGAFYAHFSRRTICSPRRSIAGTGLRTRAARRGARRRAEGLSRQGRAGRRARPPACWPPCPPTSPARPAGAARLRQPAPRGDRRAAPAPRSASSMPMRRWRRSWPSAPSPSPAPRATRGSATGCCAARARAVRPLLKPRASPKRKRSKSRRKAAGARRSRRAARSRGGRAAAGPKARSSASRR